MTGFVVLLGGITLFALIITVLDGIAYRRRRNAGRNVSTAKNSANVDVLG